MTAGIIRVNGGAKPGDFRGGYQPRMFKIAGDYSVNYAAVDSLYEKAVRAIENVSTIVQVGIPTAAGFIVVVDGGNYYGRDDKTGYAADTSAATLASNVLAATAVAATVTEVVFTGIALV